ncbi:unnamed protein product [Symbiodinium sp. CCMP2456]|nr:unnamed protein product [Symbiodinium sp. CCMP2456]
MLTNQELFFEAMQACHRNSDSILALVSKVCAKMSLEDAAAQCDQVREDLNYTNAIFATLNDACMADLSQVLADMKKFAAEVVAQEVQKKMFLPGSQAGADTDSSSPPGLDLDASKTDTAQKMVVPYDTEMEAFKAADASMKPVCDMAWAPHLEKDSWRGQMDEDMRSLREQLQSLAEKVDANAASIQCYVDASTSVVFQHVAELAEKHQHRKDLEATETIQGHRDMHRREIENRTAQMEAEGWEEDCPAGATCSVKAFQVNGLEMSGVPSPYPRGAGHRF